MALKLFPNLNTDAHYCTMPAFGLPTDPLAQCLISWLAQEQAAGFLASHGTLIPDVNFWSQMWFGVDLFETPPKFLTEDLNW